MATAAAGSPSFTGAITFGLVGRPVARYSVIGSEHGPGLHACHREDAGRIRQSKDCGAENRELRQGETARGRERGGLTVVLTVEDTEQSASEKRPPRRAS
ncbi:Ku protein [Streptacidiphilus jiangxiensis]|uniref:Ku protein n=1 Tax=Streptacidiphilus jiangxiensis TaxID=235985 RepID=UPI0034E25475